MTTTQTGNAQAKQQANPGGTPQGGGGQAAPAAMTRPFRVGVQPIDDLVYDNTVSTLAGTQTLPLYSIPANGFLNDVFLYAVGTTSANAATVAFSANGPWNVIDSITFNDIGNSPIIGPIDGWTLMIINKFGGYAFSDDPKASPIYSATTGSGSTGGSFAFVLRIPIELCPRDGLGSLPNKYAQTPFTIKVTVAATTTVYSTAPTTAPSVRFRMTPVSYWEPAQNDSAGNPLADNPPSVDTTAFWNMTPYTVNSGAMAPQLTSSVGYPIRNLIFILADSSQSRSQGESDFPDPFQLKINNNIIVNRVKALWQTYIAQDFGYTGAVGDTVNCKDNGVYPLSFCKDFYPKPGWESRRGYLPTSDGMRFQALGTIGGSGSHTLSVLTNYIGIGGGAPLATIQV